MLKLLHLISYFTQRLRLSPFLNRQIKAMTIIKNLILKISFVLRSRVINQSTIPSGKILIQHYYINNNMSPDLSLKLNYKECGVYYVALDSLQQ